MFSSFLSDLQIVYNGKIRTHFCLTCSIWACSNPTPGLQHKFEVRVDCKIRMWIWFLFLFQDINKRLSLPADIRLPDDYLEKFNVNGSALFEQPISRRLRRVSLVQLLASTEISILFILELLFFVNHLCVFVVGDRLWEAGDLCQTGQTGRGMSTGQQNAPVTVDCVRQTGSLTLPWSVIGQVLTDPVQ